jgi:predicted double-glycine peptidase
VRAIAIALAVLAIGCAHYRGTSRPIDARRLAEPGWTAISGVPFVRATTDAGCGPAVLAMMLAYHQRAASDLRTADGASARELRAVLQARELDAYVLAGNRADLERELVARRPVIVGTIKEIGARRVPHFELVIAVHRDGTVVTLDPAGGPRAMPASGFEAEWAGSGHTMIVAAPR